MLNNGTQMQEDVISSYCKQNNIVLDASFVDEAISGKRVDRPSLIEMLATLEKGDKVIVQNTSRLWRDDYAKIIIKRELENIGADVISIEQPDYTISFDNPTDYLIKSMLEILDTFDKLNIALKLKKGRIAKAKKGDKACGSAPYGYKWDDAEVVIDYNNHLIVREIFEQYDLYLNHLAVMNPLGKVVEYCKEKGYKTHRGNDFSKQTLSVMLHNDFYIGVVTHSDKKVLGNHEPIIDRELFENVNPNYDFSILG